MATVELICLAIIAVAALLRARAPGAREALADAPIIGLAALVAEDSAIRLYGFYEYAPGWHLFLDQVPLLIPTIWVFVVISSRDVARALNARAGPLAALALVWYDASFIEPIAAHAGLWHWNEPGPFGVPLIGTLGWGFFAAAISFGLSRLRGWRRWLLLVLAPLATHVLLLASWWGLLRWIPRGGDAEGVALSAGVAVVLVALATATRRTATLPFWVVAPRLPAACFFAGLLAATAPEAALMAYSACFVAPWLLSVQWRAGRLSPRAGLTRPGS